MSATKRREFLRTALFAALSLGALAIGGWRWLREAGARREAVERALPTDPSAILVGALRTELSYLQIEGDGLERFAAEFLADPRGRWRPGERLSRGVATHFLMSTDFFQNGADEARPLRYVAYYGPYRSPCYNPLAQLPA